MRRIRFSAAWAVLPASFVLAGCLIALGCGGGGGGGGSSPGGGGALTARGKVTLPAGFKLPLSQLQVLSDMGQAKVNADGTFASPVVSSGARMVQLSDKVSGKTVLFGYVNAGTSGAFASGTGAINPTTTADALLFFGVLGTALAPSDWAAFQASIIGTTPESQVSTAIAKDIVSNPTGLTDGDGAILNAVAAVQNTYVAPHPAIASLANLAAASPAKATQLKPRVSVQKITVTKAAETGALIEVQPIGPQASLIIQPNPTGDGIVAVSTSRRRGAIFVYKVGTGPDTKHITPINPPEETASDVEIEPTEEIGSIQVGFLKGLAGIFAYLPVTNEPIPLEADPVAKITVYDVVAIGPGPIDSIPFVEKVVAPNSASAQAQYDKEWRSALLHAQLRVLLKDIVKPLLIECILTNVEAEEVGEDDALEETLETVAESAPGLAEALSKGDLKGAGEALMEAIHENLGSIRDKTVAALEKSLVDSGKISGAAFDKSVTGALSSAANCVALIGVVNKGIAVADVTQAFHDNTTYEDADSWVADVLQPVISLTPQKSLVDTNDPLVHMAVKIQNVSDLSTFRFQWTCTNLEGGLESSTSTAKLGTDIIPDSTAVYVTDFTKFAVGTVDTVTVTVYDENDLVNPLGTATATVKGAPAPCTTTAPPPILTGPAPPVITLSEPNTRPGDTFTVTVNWPTDGARNELLEVTLFSAPGDFTAEANKNEAAKLVSVDGVAAKSDTKDVFFTFNKLGQYPSNTYPTTNTAIAQTHTLVFQMQEPTDLQGDAEPYCSVKSSNSTSQPYIIVTGFGGDGGVPSESQAFFNENP